MPDDRDDSTKTKATHLYLSDNARAMIDELGRKFFPGRPRVQSLTVEKIIRERYEQEMRKNG